MISSFASVRPVSNGTDPLLDMKTEFARDRAGGSAEAA